ncbi:MAG: CAP domain-containing protein [Gammaproteobacteria bacterium]
MLTKAAADYEQQVVELVNQERWNNGQLSPLKRVTELDSAAELHSGNMGTRNFFAHCDLDTGTLPSNRAIAAGYGAGAAENIAAGYTTPSAVMTGWMTSTTGHRENILSASYREIGVGYVLDSSDSDNVRLESNGDCNADGGLGGPYYHYWTQNFGQRSSVYPVIINREAYVTTSRSVQLYLYGTGWAQEMRLNNDGGTWTAWQPFSANVANWQLSAGNGTKTVNVELRNGATVRTASDTIILEGQAGNDVILQDQFE